MAQIDLLPGTLDLLIPRALAREPRHGLGVSRRIWQITGGALDVKPGSLFPALHRLEEQGWLRSAWGDSAKPAAGELLHITPAGQKQFREETRAWHRISLAMDKALETE